MLPPEPKDGAVWGAAANSCPRRESLPAFPENNPHWQQLHRYAFSLNHCEQIPRFYICKLKCNLILGGGEWERNQSCGLSEPR